MAHSDLFDEMFRILLEGVDRGEAYAVIDEKRGVCWRSAIYGGCEDALPREQLLIASVAQTFADEMNGIHWEKVGERWGAVFYDTGKWIALNDLGINLELGFYSLSEFPDAPNDASGY